jgi:hypothetical protein
VFREDIGHAASVLELEGLSRKKRQFKLEAIKNTICFGTDTQSEKAAVISSERISERIVLSLEFFKDILDHPIPTDMEAAKALSCSPAALNLFTWLSYRCFVAKGRERVSLFGETGLVSQLGSADYSGPRKARRLARSSACAVALR